MAKAYQFKLKAVILFMKEKNMWKFVFYLIPLSFLGSGFIFFSFRFVISLFLFIMILQSHVKFKNLFIGKNILLYLLIYVYLAISIYYSIRAKRLSVLPSVFLLYEFFVLFVNSKGDEANEYISFFLRGCLYSSFIGVLYMIITGNIVRGGDFTENGWGISNLTIPLYLSSYFVYQFITYLYNGNRRIIGVLFCISIIPLLILLGKRGPIIFMVLSIILSVLVFSPKIKKFVLVFIFLFPLYELPVTIYITDNLIDPIEKIFGRSEDFDYIEKNPRIYRLNKAVAFITDFEWSDAVGYHEELYVAEHLGDEDHNHFHNMFLQLYYERGFVGVLIILFLILVIKRSYLCDKRKQWNFGVLSLLTLVGTNESVLMASTSSEIVLMFILFGNLVDNET